MQVEGSIHDINQNIASILQLLKEQVEANSKQIPVSTSQLSPVPLQPKTSLAFSPSVITSSHPNQSILTAEPQQQKYRADPAKLNPEPVVAAILPCNSIGNLIAGVPEKTSNWQFPEATEAASQANETPIEHRVSYSGFIGITALAEAATSGQPEIHQRLKESLITPASPSIEPEAGMPSIHTDGACIHHQNNGSYVTSVPGPDSFSLQGAMQENFYDSKWYGRCGISPEARQMHSAGPIVTKYMI